MNLNFIKQQMKKDWEKHILNFYKRMLNGVSKRPQREL